MVTLHAGKCSSSVTKHPSPLRPSRCNKAGGLIALECRFLTVHRKRNLGRTASGDAPGFGVRGECGSHSRPYRVRRETGRKADETKCHPGAGSEPRGRMNPSGDDTKGWKWSVALPYCGAEVRSPPNGVETEVPATGGREASVWCNGFMVWG